MSESRQRSTCFRHSCDELPPSSPATQSPDQQHLPQHGKYIIFCNDYCLPSPSTDTVLPKSLYTLPAFAGRDHGRRFTLTVNTAHRHSPRTREVCTSISDYGLCYTPFTRYNRLSDRFDNRFDNPLSNRLYNRLSNRLYNRLVCLHDAAGCPTCCATEQPVVQPV